MKEHYIESRNYNQQRLLFSKYKGDREIFIETGSFEGDGIQAAIDSGYKYIYSIEVQPHYYEHCQRRFGNYNNVSVLLGDSGSLLKEILSSVNQPAVFWLDGHYSGGATGSSGIESPLLQEVSTVIDHDSQDHVVMIDDVRDFKDSQRIDTVTKQPLGFDIYQIIDVIENTWENIKHVYDTKRIDREVFINDVLVIYRSTYK